MKIKLCLLAMLIPSGLDAQLTATHSDAIVVAPYQVVTAGPHERVWQQAIVDAKGVTNVNSYTEIATGLSFWDEEKGAWEETKEEFEISPEGYAIAGKG